MPPVDTSQDLFNMFNLGSIATSVARFDEKGNKKALRKSYKSQIKSLKIEGKFEPVEKPNDADDRLDLIVQTGDAEWFVHNVQGRETENGLPEDVLELLDSACTMNKGNVTSIWNPSVLGDVGLGKLSVKGRQTAPGTPIGGTPRGTVGRSNAMNAARTSLDPNLKNKKRGYEGFGEGLDDDGGETGYSTAEGDERAPAQKRRKKVLLPGLVLYLHHSLLTCLLCRILGLLRLSRRYGRVW